MPSAQNVLEYKCPCCGAGLIFSGAEQKLTCEYCDNSFDLETVKQYNASINLTDSQDFNWEEHQDAATLRDPSMAAATITGGQAEAMKTAAGNQNGAMMGFMGMNMAQMAGGMDANQLYQMGQQRAAAPSPAPAQNSWKCKCGAENTGKFCTEFGAAQVVGWICACGNINKGKCSECGAKKPAAEPLYRCDKCGWEPEDPKNPPKFCPECGDKFY